MAAITLRVPTIGPNGQGVPGGHCYILFPEPVVTLRELIYEKVAAECRKRRAAGTANSDTLAYLVSNSALTNLRGYAGEKQVQLAAVRHFQEHDYAIIIDDKLMAPRDLDEPIKLTRRTTIAFVCPGYNAEPTPASGVGAALAEVASGFVPPDAATVARHDWRWYTCRDHTTGDKVVMVTHVHRRQDNFLLGHVQTDMEAIALFKRWLVEGWLLGPTNSEGEYGAF